MKLNFLNLFFKTVIVTTPFLTSPYIPLVPLDPLRFNSVEQGPFQEGDRIELTFSVICTEYAIENISVGIIGCDGSNKEWVNKDTYMVKSRTFDLDYNVREHVNLLLTGKCATAAHTHYRLCLIDEDDGQAFGESVFFDLYIRPKNYDRKTINPTYYQNSRYELPKDCFRIVNNKVFYSGEYFEFENFYDFFLIDEYYRLKMDQYKCYSHLEESFSWIDAYIELVNPQPCFNYLCDSDGKISFPIVLINHDNQYFSLDFANYLYVNPNNYEMSLKPKIGFRQTKYFYLPINCQEQVKKQEFLITITGIGYWKTNMSWSSYVPVDVNLIGDCSNSKYCVVGGQS